MKKYSKPTVTVLMPVYNSALYVSEAINSILKQSYSNFEFLIIDDASTDNSVEIIRKFKDERIRLIRNEKNLRLVGVLNKGIDIAEGKYIVRMDSDDISLPDRLKKQVDFMNANCEIGMSGGWMRNFGESKNLNIYPLSYDEIKATILFKNPFSHPTMIMRKDVLDRYNLRYNIDYAYVEDYELWLRSFEKIKMANIPEVLLLYRIGNNNISRIHNDIQNKLSKELYRKNLQKIGIVDNDVLDVLTNKKGVDSFDLLSKLYDNLERLIKENSVYNKKVYNDCIQEIWNIICYKSSSLGLSAFTEYYKFKLGKNKRFEYLKEVRFFLKSIFKV